jgi:AraC-like DNA-binding protein
MNETTLRHLFQKQEDESFRGYVERMRMTKALQLLSGGKWVKEVIREAKYKNRSTFNNAFKKRFKHTPGFFKIDSYPCSSKPALFSASKTLAEKQSTKFCTKTYRPLREALLRNKSLFFAQERY